MGCVELKCSNTLVPELRSENGLFKKCLPKLESEEAHENWKKDVKTKSSERLPMAV